MLSKKREKLSTKGETSLVQKGERSLRTKGETRSVKKKIKAQYKRREAQVQKERPV
jgi:hypothetical protein